jgi:hypothetical protein
VADIRTGRLPKSVAESAQTLVVETSQKLAQPRSPGDVGEARDYMWTGLMKEWQEARATQRAEGIELAHVKLFGHRPDAYRGVAESIIKLDNGALKCFDELLDAAQDAVGGYEGENRTHYQPAQLGNELRRCLVKFENALDENARQALKFVSTRLQAIISGTGEQVIDRMWKAETPDQKGRNDNGWNPALFVLEIHDHSFASSQLLDTDCHRHVWTCSSGRSGDRLPVQHARRMDSEDSRARMIRRLHAGG